MFGKVLIADRGVAARRIAATLERLGVAQVAVHTEAERNARHVESAEQAVCVVDYADAEAILEAARRTGAQAIHPGWGALAGSPEFSALCEQHGIAFLGPRPVHMRPLLSPQRSMGLATLLKIPTAGSILQNARRVAVAVLGDGAGRAVALGDVDVTLRAAGLVQAPAAVEEAVRPKIHSAAARLVRAVEYRGAANVEFLYDSETERFYFLRVGTHLAPENLLIEELTGLDLMEWMLRLGAGETVQLPQATIAGGAMQAQIRAEDPWKKCAPTAGRLVALRFPEHVRVEAAAGAGDEVCGGLLAVVTARGDIAAALEATELSGVETNLRYLRQLSRGQKGAYRSHAFEVLQAGTQTTVQDYPGRLGYWDVGVPPSGPMDALSFRMANRIVGNADGEAALEITVLGPTLRFRSRAVVAVTGAPFAVTLNDAPAPMWTPVEVPAGGTLKIGACGGAGLRCYLAVRGGLDVPEYLGSKSTFILGKFGGAAGRILQSGDVLHWTDCAISEPAAAAVLPEITRAWTIGVLYGPHGAPDYFTARDIDTFFGAEWRVHHNSDRTGVRLIGPKPEWARKDGGEAGLHPSNIHDNAYAIGSLDFTGDMPVILGPDGPSLGGFVCPAVIVQAELWKLGQLRPGDTVHFVPMRLADAEAMERQIEAVIATLSGELPRLPEPAREGPVLFARPDRGPGIVCRADGDKYLLVEYGPNVLDMKLRYRAHRLEQRLRAAALPGMIDITAGIRSLQLHYDSRKLRRQELLEAIDAFDRELTGAGAGDAVEARVVHLPLSWDDPATRLAIERYMQSVRPDAPWCPSNIEFIRRINGLRSVDDVYRTVFSASYLVLGLGDVYLGAPVATPLDPRHRLVTTKYNPARTWTPENAVGIGGAYLCVYGMEGPGGYQFVGRTLQMWNSWRTSRDFEPGRPWLLRLFDQIRFYPVSAQELLELRQEFHHGRFTLRTEPARFSLAEYEGFLAEIARETAEFEQRRNAAFREERERWRRAAEDAELQPAGDLQ
jgi:urea carboxylase